LSIIRLCLACSYEPITVYSARWIDCSEEEAWRVQHQGRGKPRDRRWWPCAAGIARWRYGRQKSAGAAKNQLAEVVYRPTGTYVYGTVRRWRERAGGIAPPSTRSPKEQAANVDIRIIISNNANN